MLKRLIPKPLRQYARKRHQDYILGKSVDRFAALEPGAAPPAELLSDLVYGWGNKGYSAEHEYLAALTAHARRARTPILECGSGLSTILLGIAAQRNGNVVWSLEHHPKWAELIQRRLDRFGIKAVELCIAPLRPYEDFDWYDAPLERMPQSFSLVVCDGPPGATRGGRYGLVPVMREFLTSGCVLLADDASRPEEQVILQRWATQLNTKIEVSGLDKPFAIMTIP